MSRAVEDGALLHHKTAADIEVSGEFVELNGDRCYAIYNVDAMDPFFVSVISDVDHWLFVSSTGGLTAGRVSPATALFPYITVDKIHDSALHTGSRTFIRVPYDDGFRKWEPFNPEQDDRYSVSRNLYKSLLGNTLCFEEINHDLQLVFRYTWMTSNEFGFVRYCQLENLGNSVLDVELIDGIQNILPAGTPLFAQSNTSNLVDAYKWTEVDPTTGLALYTLYSGITDRAEPCESLKATTVFCLGLENRSHLVSSEQLKRFARGGPVTPETHKRGIRGAYFVNAQLTLSPRATEEWCIVADLEQSQPEVIELSERLGDPRGLSAAVRASVALGADRLARIMASGDGYQATAEENVTVHHYANVLFNILRGGVFDDQYTVTAKDYSATLRSFNKRVFANNEAMIESLPASLSIFELLERTQDDPQLARLTREYLPITFGRRHGDPSRPWNQFAIHVKDDNGDDLISYQGNWRDIFQNWEALLYSYPGFTESVIAKFVNASTMDGYNPYRITKDGIDWEVEEPDDPWSYIGYWGDHQIIYLLKLLEISRSFNPDQLTQLLRDRIFCYANVPYRIADFEASLDDPKNTVRFDEELAASIDARVERMGADGKLVLTEQGEVHQVNLLEKLLVPLLSKLGNLVVDGGIWLNTQRPEWNDANNALVGHGLSMVTLYYLRRYVCFLQDLLGQETDDYAVSLQVNDWLTATGNALANVKPQLGNGPVTAAVRFESMRELGLAASDYRSAVYRHARPTGFARRAAADVNQFLADALTVVEHSISTNRRDDGLYHAYNLLHLTSAGVEIEPLYPMLEGQVAALSAGSVPPEEAVEVLQALFDSAIYRPDQKSFMLYPDRPLPDFLDRNIVAEDRVKSIPLVGKMIAAADCRIIVRDARGNYRFSSDFRNAADLRAALERIAGDYGDDVAAAREPLLELYEQTFNHRAFTGRSGTMFGFEGLGSVYWHMVAKLLLAVLETFIRAADENAAEDMQRRLGELYYRVREGIGFNKTPGEYGAFPTDPYSHTPKHSGAQQPGMTGQVKEELLCRFGELGVRVSDGVARFEPALLRAQEFLRTGRDTGYVDVDNSWQTVAVPDSGLAFTWCQVPVIYAIDDDAEAGIAMLHDDGSETRRSGHALTADETSELFRRSGHIRRITVNLRSNMLFDS